MVALWWGFRDVDNLLSRKCAVVLHCVGRYIINRLLRDRAHTFFPTIKPLETYPTPENSQKPKLADLFDRGSIG